MITLPLLGHDTERLTRRLREAYQIEIPFTKWNDQMGIRASFQGYNTQADADLLLKGLEVVLAEVIQ
jgi:isopenicillin-N epimerase